MKAIIVIAIAIVLVLSGCTQTAKTCGNNVCENGETTSCPADCAVGTPPVPTDNTANTIPALPF
jgi:protein involved in sex pheromone biosynthesis